MEHILVAHTYTYETCIGDAVTAKNLQHKKLLIDIFISES